MSLHTADARPDMHSRALILGLGAFSPLLLWTGPLLLARIVDASPAFLEEWLETSVGVLYLLMWIGIALTAVFIPTLVGSIGVAVSVRDVRRRRLAQSLLALVLNVLALAIGTAVALSLWFLD